MAKFAAVSDGNWSTAGTWNQVVNTPTLHASTNITLNATTNTATFTAPNTTNKCTGVLFFVTNTGSGYSYKVTLQENSIDTAATVTIATSNFPTAGNWIYFKFASPYTFTSTTAGFYRFQIVRSGSGSSSIIAADSGGSNPAYLATEDIAGPPATTDDVWIVGANGTGTVSVTVDGSQTIGSGTDTTGINNRTIGASVTVSCGGLLKWDTTANATLTSKGTIQVGGSYAPAVVNYGEFQMGTVATPFNPSYVATLSFNENGTTVQYGLEAYFGAKITLQGTPKSSTSLWKTKYVSGVGTAADPLIVLDSVNWDVNDEVQICASSNNVTNYQETETRYIKTKNSATSYVLSTTAGGAEAALTYTHTTDAWILNTQRNVIINTTNAAHGFYTYFNPAVSGNINIDWTRFSNIGNSAANKYGVQFISANAYSNCDYSVAYNNFYRGFVMSGAKATSNYTGLISYGAASTGNVGAISPILNSSNVTLTDCFSVKNNKAGFELSASAALNLVRCYAISCNTANNTTVAGFYFVSATSSTLTDCEAHCNRLHGTVLNGVSATTLNNFQSGTKGTNAIDIDCLSSTYNSILYANSNFGSATLISNYLNMVDLSEVKFSTFNDVTNEHFWYTNYGSAQATGAGLPDTTVRTPNSLGVRLTPEDSTTGFTWSFNIYAKAMSIVSFFGYFQKNATFNTDVAKVELWLPGSTVADATATLTNVTGLWQPVSISATYNGSIDALATIKVRALSATAGAYLYADDFYNAGNTVVSTDKVTGLDTWDQGKPVSIIAPQQVSAADIWTFSTTQLTTVGTTGELLVRTEHKVDDNFVLLSTKIE